MGGRVRWEAERPEGLVRQEAVAPDGMDRWEKDANLQRAGMFRHSVDTWKVVWPIHDRLVSSNQGPPKGAVPSEQKDLSELDPGL